jgi:hypothetical protein
MFSQECAKVSIPDIYLIPIQANKARQIMGVSFDLNNTVVKIGRAFNTRRNTRLRDKCRKTKHYSKTGYLVHPQAERIVLYSNMRITAYSLQSLRDLKSKKTIKKGLVIPSPFYALVY